MSSLFQTFFGISFFGLCLVGCGDASTLPEQNLIEAPLAVVAEETFEVTLPSGELLFVELADTSQERADGLMFRTSLPDNSGMWFLFEDERPLSFWMKNTLIPLDVVYMDSEMNIVDIQTMQPCPETVTSCPSYPSAAPAQHALELNAGRAEELGLSVGDQLLLDL